MEDLSAYAFSVWVFAAAIFGLAVVSAVELPSWEVAMGEFHATEAESMECYFTIGQHTAIVFHPKSTACEIARHELRGKRGRLVFHVE